MTFEAWMDKVDTLVTDKCGLSVHDLPDCAFWDNWDGGATPSEMSEIVLEEADFYDF